MDRWGWYMVDVGEECCRDVGNYYLDLEVCLHVPSADKHFTESSIS